jgi:glycosyltransferase involved in cell wall biosynthesis
LKLQILVPQYKENEEVIRPLLDSIAIQQNVDLENEVGVIIVNDGSDVILSDEFLNRYPFKIQYILAPHRGVSAARNTALDAATAEYVAYSGHGKSTQVPGSGFPSTSCRRRSPSDPHSPPR